MPWTIEIHKTEKHAFVLDPKLRGRYVRTHRCVYYTACPICGVKIGQPCEGNGETLTVVHPTRRDLFYRRITAEAAEEAGQTAQEIRRIS